MADPERVYGYYRMIGDVPDGWEHRMDRAFERFCATQGWEFVQTTREWTEDGSVMFGVLIRLMKEFGGVRVLVPSMWHLSSDPTAAKLMMLRLKDEVGATVMVLDAESSLRYPGVIDD